MFCTVMLGLLVITGNVNADNTMNKTLTQIDKQLRVKQKRAEQKSAEQKSNLKFAPQDIITMIKNKDFTSLSGYYTVLSTNMSRHSYVVVFYNYKDNQKFHQMFYGSKSYSKKAFHNFLISHKNIMECHLMDQGYTYILNKGNNSTGNDDLINSALKDLS